MGKAKLIGIVSTKGGVGKSTISIHLSISFSEAGAKVLLVDADDQSSSLNWFANKATSKAGQNVTVISLGVKHLSSQLRKVSKGYDIVVVDGKGSRDKVLADMLARSVIDNTDFTVIPIIPDELNKDATEDFVNEVLMPLSEVKEINCGLLINRFTNTVLSKTYSDFYRGLDFPIFESCIPDMNVFKSSLAKGLSCFEHDPKNKGSQHFIKFFQELCNITGVDYGKKQLQGRSKKEETSSKSKGRRKGRSSYHPTKASSRTNASEIH